MEKNGYGIPESALSRSAMAQSVYWICGANVGDVEKILPYYYEVVDYPLICTYEFLLYDVSHDTTAPETETGA